MKKLTAIVIGLGSRGCVYSNAMKTLGDKFQVVGLADPFDAHLKTVQQWHNVPQENCYDSWEAILDQPKMADFAVIATQDNMHLAPALKAIEKGYNILLEKPVAPTPEECAAIANAAEAKGVKVLVCHVLRYTNFYGRVKQLILDGAIGEVMSLVAVEAVGNIHQSHSFVRGNWHKKADSAPMILAKCSHDLDIIQWLVDKPCKKIHSFGGLSHFTKENAPAGAPKRCIDGGCPAADTCVYNAKRIYVDDHTDANWYREVATAKFSIDGAVATDEETVAALKNNNYGICVYQMDNDVVDHQVVNMEFEGGATASLTMNAFNKGGRYIRIFGTKGELYANMGDEEITLYTFADKQYQQVSVKAAAGGFVAGHGAGHGGGDIGIMNELYDYFSDTYTGYKATNISTSVKNHLLAFAAEESRLNNTVVDMDKFVESFGMKNEFTK
ncbi:MAG: Gfo/Idh/MocA family oxidoreductase [Oscillospiraceae bacterium]|nr:Gfo/Idh/MocA family oxidoreductase [Oscillospiraceae bacterium]